LKDGHFPLAFGIDSRGSPGSLLRRSSDDIVGQRSRHRDRVGCLHGVSGAFDRAVPCIRSTDANRRRGRCPSGRLPDGTTAKLIYPPDLDLAGLGVRPYWAGCARDFGFHYYDPYGTVYGGDPIQTWTRSDGQTVSLWNSVEKEPGVDNQPLVYLIFRFGDWTVDVYDYRGRAALSDDQRTACAKGLSGSVIDDGWIVISGSPEIDLGGAEPELEFGGLGSDEPFVLFFPGPCKPESDANEELPLIGGVPVSRTKGFASWCHRGEMMRIHVYFSGKSTFVEQLIRDLEIRDVHLAS
jgi:hypothetical protein